MPKFIVSGGGTGGHIFPAVAIAKELQRLHPGCKILFVGAQGRMEMEKVPAEGFDIVGLPIEGLKRSLSPRNFLVLAKAVYSLAKARRLLREFQPQAVIGTGGYASLPICRAAAGMGIPTFLQEQNGFAGLTNKSVGPKARHIFTGFPDMDRFFPKGRWTFTGNPVREAIVAAGSLQGAALGQAQKEARQAFGLLEDKPVLLLTGGSLGARTLNQALHAGLDRLEKAGIQVIWQMGKLYASEHLETLQKEKNTRGTGFPEYMEAFVSRMDQAYLAADLVISRAGALSVSEIAVMGKASLLVPSPNVTDDHQTKNAELLSQHGAAVLLPDAQAAESLIDAAISLLADSSKRAELQAHLAPLAKPLATQTIAHAISQALGLSFDTGEPLTESLAEAAAEQNQAATEKAASPVPAIPEETTAQHSTASAAFKAVYFLGIGGIGMSAIARYYQQNGWQVAGYDKTPSPLTESLQAEGMHIHFDEAVEAIPEIFRQRAQEVLWVLTPAVPVQHSQRQWLEAQGLIWKKRSEVLGLLAREHFTIAIAGTHGKTTTSTLLAHLLNESPLPVTAFLGGISSNFNSNYLHNIQGQGRRIVVLEADEFDRSFHRLSPDVALITAIDPDHLDIYGSPEAFQDAFVEFAHKLRGSGPLFLNQALSSESFQDLPLQRYGWEAADYRAENVRVENGEYHFDFVFPGGRQAMHCGLPGRHNVENAVGALGICHGALGLNPAELAPALASFRGAKRRFERLVSGPRYTLIDDYAHHPQEIQAFLRSVREMHPDRKLTGVFQPHLFTRTRDFAEGFAESLGLLDELWLMPIYPAREEPLPGISSDWLLSLMQGPQTRAVVPADQIPAKAQAEKPELLLLIGAGDIDRLCAPLTQLYHELNSNA